MALFVVESRVRAPLPNHSKAPRRAVIATLYQHSSQQQPGGGSTSHNTTAADTEDGTTAVVLFDDEYNSGKSSSQRFLIASNLASVENEIEATLPLKSLLELLDFEKPSKEETEEDSLARPSSRIWKECGDRLLRLQDQAAAVFCYGGTVLVKASVGHVAAEEIHCIGDKVDISFVKTREEAMVPKSKILLAVAEPSEDSFDHFQACVRSRRRCTLVLALCTCMKDGTDNIAAASSFNLQMSAFLLQAGLQKFTRALTKHLSLHPLGNSCNGSLAPFIW